MRKAIIIILAMVVALSALPITFACYNGGWGKWDRFWKPRQPVYCCENYCKVIFFSTSTSDNEEVKDVATTNASIKDCGNKLVITIDNAYPGYDGIIDFCIKNTGTLAATINDIIINDTNLGGMQINLTGDIQQGTVILPCSTECGQLVIGDLPQENTQGKIFTFDITIDFECTCGGGCETAYAYYNQCVSTCFLSMGYSSWGWTNGPLGPGDYTFDIYAGAAQCNLSKGENIGTLTLNYDGETAHVYYDITGSGYTMTSTHLYIGRTPIPPNNKPGAPGQYPYKHDNLNNVVTDEYTVPACGPIYIIAHAVACE